MSGSPKSEIAPKFRDQLETLAEYAQAQGDAVLGETPPKWYRPADFEGSLRDLDAISEPFSRGEIERYFEEAVKDSESPGTVGDLAIVQLQGDALAAMERAFRARHASAARCRVHAAARLRGHGHPHGVIRGSLLGYLINLDRRNKS